MNERIEKAYAQRPKRWVFELSVAVIVTALIVWSATAVETSGTTQNGGKIALNILSGIFHPDTGLLFNLTVQGVPYLLLETVCIAFLGTVVGAVISIPLAFLSASNLTPKPIAFIGRIIIMAVRTVPAFIYGLMFIRVTGPGAFAGLLTMSLCSVGMVSKMYIEAIEDLDVRVLESLDAAGSVSYTHLRYSRFSRRSMAVAVRTASVRRESPSAASCASNCPFSICLPSASSAAITVSERSGARTRVSLISSSSRASSTSRSSSPYSFPFASIIRSPPPATPRHPPHRS